MLKINLKNLENLNHTGSGAKGALKNLQLNMSEKYS